MKHEKIRLPLGDQLPEAAQLRELLARQQKPLRLDALLRLTGLPRRSKKALEALLRQLEAEGALLRLHGGAWAETSSLRAVTGRYSVTRSGAGFVTPLEANEHGRKVFSKDIFIHPAQTNGAWHGDLVRVLLTPGAAKGKNPEGRIVAVVERGQKEVAVRVERLRGACALCRPADPRLNITFETDLNGLDAAVHVGDLLLVSPETEVSADFWQARACSAFGNEDEVRVQEQLVKLNHQAPSDFPPRVLEEAHAFQQNPCAADMEGRSDVRDIPFVTIDGHSARDFDDAVHVSPTPEGGWLLRVGIADVTHYMRAGSALDKEALERGNSWYFPTSVEPMLPEALSNGLCSLNPDVDRLIMLAEITFSAKGQPLHSRFSAAVMRSAARLTYGQVKRLLTQESPEELQALRAQPRGADVLAMLEEAHRLADVLSAVRDARGSLDFDLPEAEYIFDERGHVQDIRHKERNFAHKLIEEFMIAANEAVARFLEEKGLPFLYRVHPEPEEDRLQALFDTLKSTDMAAVLPSKPSAGALRGILRDAADTPQEYLVSRLVLRTMPQARYQPLNEGHFGLGSACYCHFTSPIRRYADVIVHRALKQALGIQGGMAVAEHKLLRVGDQLNRRERAAMEAEREMTRRLVCLALHGREGEEFEGTICSVNDFGIFVEFSAMPAEGMIRVEDLGDDFYEYDPDRQELLGAGTGRRFRLGQPLRVRLDEVNAGRLEVRLGLAGETRGGGRRGGPRRKQGGYGTPFRPSGKGHGGQAKEGSKGKPAGKGPKGGKKSKKIVSYFGQDVPRGAKKAAHINGTRVVE